MYLRSHSPVISAPALIFFFLFLGSASVSRSVKTPNGHSPIVSPSTTIFFTDRWPGFSCACISEATLMRIMLHSSRPVNPTLTGTTVTLDDGPTGNPATFQVGRIRLQQQGGKFTISAFGDLFLAIRQRLGQLFNPYPANHERLSGRAQAHKGETRWQLPHRQFLCTTIKGAVLHYLTGHLQQSNRNSGCRIRPPGWLVMHSN